MTEARSYTGIKKIIVLFDGE